MLPMLSYIFNALFSSREGFFFSLLNLCFVGFSKISFKSHVFPIEMKLKTTAGLMSREKNEVDLDRKVV